MGKRVLLTGCSGFIGAHCVEYFLEKTDWEIIGLDSFRHKGTFSRLSEIANYNKDRVRILNYDIATPLSPQLENQIMDRRIDDRGNIISKPLHYIINMASDSAVERSTVDPVSCLRNNYDLAINMLEFSRRVKPQIFFQVSTDEIYGDCPPGYSHPEWDTILPSNPYAASKAAQEAIAIAYWRTFDVPVVLTNCYDMQTKAFTPLGIKSYDELKVGDMVWALNDKGEMVQEPILEKVKMPFSGKMVRFKSNKVDQLVTPNHRMMVQRAIGKPRRYGQVEEIYAEKLVGLQGRVRIPTCGKWSGESCDYSSIINQSYFHPTARKLPENVSSDWLFDMIGWYVSEGYLAGSAVAFGGSKVGQQDKLKAIFNYLGVNPAVSSNGRAILAGHKGLYKLVEYCGEYAENKVVPEFIINAKPNLLQKFWDAAMAGDGSFIKTNNGGTGIVYYTKSWRLAEQMCEVGMKLGMAVRICSRWTWNPTKTIKAKSYIVRFRKPEADIEARNITEECYDGDVWCLRVASGRIFVERGGKISLSGQTMNNIGEWQDKEKFLPKIIWKVATGQEMEIYGDNPQSIGTRFYLHAKNHADVFCFLARQPVAMYKEGHKRPDRYNVCGDVEMNNLELAQLVAEIMGKPLKYRLIPSESARKGYDRRYALDGSKLTELGWTPPVTFRESIERIVKWTVANPHWVV